MRQLILERVAIVPYRETTRVLNQFDLCLDNILLRCSLPDLRDKLVLRCLIHVLVVVFADL